ncbi:uncharacterized protein LOC144568636 [Carex rostrata]
MFTREMRGRGGGMDEVKQDKSPLASHSHRPERACTRGVLQPFSKWEQGLWMGASRNDLSFSRQCRQVPKPPVRRGRTPNKHKKPAVMPTSQNTAPDATFYAPKPTNNSVDDDMKKLATVPENRQLLIISVGSASKEQKTTQNYPVLC